MNEELSIGRRVATDYVYIAFCFFVSILYPARALADTNLSSPGTLNTPGEVYRLTQNVVATGTAFTISADNIILDLDGHIITYDNGTTSSNRHGIDVNASGATVKNGTIIQGIGKSSGSSAIYLRKGNEHEIHHMIIKTDGVESQGIYGTSSHSEIHHCFINCQSTTDRTDGQGAECIRVVGNGGGLNVYNNVLVRGHRGISMGSTGFNNGTTSHVYNNLIQHDRIQNSKSAYAWAIGKGRNVHFHNNQIITDQGRGINLDGLGQGVAIGAVNNQVYDNRIDVQMSPNARSGGGSYPSTNLYGIRSRYSSYSNSYTNNIVIVDNNVNGRSLGFYIGSDSTDPLMYDILIENNTVIARDPGGDAQRTVCFAWGYADEVICRNNEYSTDQDVQKDVDGGKVTNLTFTGNSEIIPSNYTPGVPTGLSITKFLDSYLLCWNDNMVVYGETQTYEYKVYMDGRALDISTRGGMFYVDVDRGGAHSYQVSAVNLNGDEGIKCIAVSTSSAVNGWSENSIVAPAAPNSLRVH